MNLIAPAILCREAIRTFGNQEGGGIIVNVASRAAFRGDQPEMMHYAASKAGLVALTRSIARGYGAQNIAAYVVAPGFVRTRMTAGLPSVPFATTPDGVADAVVGALASGAETVWVPAILRWVMVVARHLPRPLFRRWPA